MKRKRKPHVEVAEGQGAVDPVLSKISGVVPVVLRTREASTANIRQQRDAAIAASNPSSTSSSRAPPPVVSRISRLPSSSRTALITGIEEAASTSPSGLSARAGSALSLRRRLISLGLSSIEVQGDGNCQYRAIADQLFGSEEHHALVRTATVSHMRRHADFFSIYFESTRKWEAYLRGMEQPRKWGDELTLRAAVEAFRCVAHVITSDAANWYLVYRPDGEGEANSIAEADILSTSSGRRKIRPPPHGKAVFLSYISPIHYNSVRALAEA